VAAIEQLIADNIDVWSSAVQSKKGVGRGSSKKIDLYGIKKLRELILELAVRGLLVSQNSDDEPASVLLEKIAAEKELYFAENKIKKLKALPEISDHEKPFKIPVGWEWVRLSEAADVVRGVTYKKHDSSDIEFSGSIPLMRANNIGRSLNFEKLIHIPADLVQGKQRIIKGDLLIAMSSGSANLVGKAAQAKYDIGHTFGAFCAVIRAYSDFMYPFFGFYFSTPFYRKQAQETGKGIGIQNLNKAALGMLLIPIPSVKEQHRIVAKVDELMTLCDQLEQQQENSITAHKTLVETLLSALTNAANKGDFNQAWTRIAEHFDTLFTTEHSIDQLKQTILQLAVMGKLVPQEPSDEPASDLLDKIAFKKESLLRDKKLKPQKKATHYDEPIKFNKLPKGWVAADFGDITFNRDAERIPLSVSDRRTRTGQFDYYGASGVIDSIDDFLFDKPLLLIGEDGANLVNRSTPIAFMAYGQYWVNNHAHVIDGITEDVLRYICLYINSISLLPYITGMAQPKMNQAKMNSILIAVPPENEQIRIMAKVDELMALCENLKLNIIKAQTTQLYLADVMAEQALN